MLSSAFRSAFRALLKRPGFSFLNGFSLALGLACFLLIGVFVANELRYDRHHEDADRIVRIGLSGYPASGGSDHFAMVSAPVGEALRNNFPEIESLVRFTASTPSVRVGDREFSPEVVWNAEPEVFDVFTMPIVEGRPEGLLREPGTVVLTQSTAQQFFGAESPVGQMIILDDTLRATVSAVVEDQPRTSHLAPEMFISWSTYEDQVSPGWLSVGVYTYAKLIAGTPNEEFDKRISGLVAERMGDQLAGMGLRVELVAEPMTDIYLHSTRSYPPGPVGDMTQVWIFGAVALFVLVLAVINFTNLSTARSMERAREVGIRKVVGSSRGALVAQFLGESLVMAMASFALSLLIVAAGLPLLNAMAGKEIALGEMLAFGNLFLLLGVTLLAGLLGGLYPALVMSGFESVTVLKGSFHARGAGAWLRKALVSFQFAISIALLAGTAIVMRQLDYMQSQDLGFDEEQMLVVNLLNLPSDQVAGQSQTILSEFEKVSGVIGTSMSRFVPGRGSGRILFSAEGLADGDMRSGSFIPVGFDYFDNYGIEIVAGRALSADFPADPDESIVVSVAMTEHLGWGSPDEALGKWIQFGGDPVNVVGVAEDYHHSSLRQSVEPMLFVHLPQSVGYLSLRLAGDDLRAAREGVEEVWAGMFPASPLDAFFLDEDYNQQYQSEERLRSLFSIFAVLAVVIACLGLIGLATFTAQQRTKEIGVRKVMGASVPGIVALLSREFAILVGVGFLLALPMAMYGMNLWIGTFPYQAGLGVWPFVLAGGGTLAIALLSVGFQSMRAALADPVRSLRYE